MIFLPYEEITVLPMFHTIYPYTENRKVIFKVEVD